MLHIAILAGQESGGDLALDGVYCLVGVLVGKLDDEIASGRDWVLNIELHREELGLGDLKLHVIVEIQNEVLQLPDCELGDWD